MFAALLAPGLWLARQRNEPALAGGATTTPAACLMLLVLRYSLAAAAEQWPVSRATLCTFAASFGYFSGTVPHVESLIRRRGNRRSEAASLL